MPKDIEPAGEARYRGRKEWAAHVYKSFWNNKALSMEARCLWVSIYMYYSPGRPQPWVSLYTLAETLGKARTTLRRWRQELVDKGFLKITYAENENRCFYDLTDEANAWAEDGDANENNGSDGGVVHGEPGGRSKLNLGEVHGEPRGRFMVNLGEVHGEPRGRFMVNLGGAQKTGVKSSKPEGLTEAVLKPKSTHRNTTTTTPSKTSVAVPRGSSSISASRGDPDAHPPAEGGDPRAALAPQAASGARNPESKLNASSDEDYSPEKEAQELGQGYTEWMRIFTRKKITLEAPALVAAREFFQLNRFSDPEHTRYDATDILYICVKGVVMATANPAPEGRAGEERPPFDPWFFCRRYADRPNLMFHEDQHGDLFMLHMKREIGYDQPLAIEEQTAYLVAQATRVKAARLRN